MLPPLLSISLLCLSLPPQVHHAVTSIITVWWWFKPDSAFTITTEGSAAPPAPVYRKRTPTHFRRTTSEGGLNSLSWIFSRLADQVIRHSRTLCIVPECFHPQCNFKLDWSHLLMYLIYVFILNKTFITCGTWQILLYYCKCNNSVVSTLHCGLLEEAENVCL